MSEIENRCYVEETPAAAPPVVSYSPSSLPTPAPSLPLLNNLPISVCLDSATTNKWSKNGFGVPVTKQSGKFSREESELVRKAVEEFCAAKQIPTSRLCSECDHKAELKGAWMEIAKQLPHRSVQSVYRHGIRQLHPFKRGAWSEQECITLHELVQRMGKKWAAIQAKMNRSADSCRDKHREMSDEYVKGRWKDSETEQLKCVIREQLNVPSDMDMKDLGKLVEEEGMQISWSSVSKRMGMRSRLSCFKKWQKMSGVLSITDDLKRKISHDLMDGDSSDNESSKRIKSEDVIVDTFGGGGGGGSGSSSGAVNPYADAPTAGAAAAMAAACQQAVADAEDFDDAYSAKIAAETVEAVDLPDTDILTV